MKKADLPHIPVLAEEILRAFEEVEIHTFFEGTLGAGGHAKLFLEAHPEIETYIGSDRDGQALKLARENLEPWKKKIRFVHGNFRDLDELLAAAGVEKVDGFFLTLGCLRCSSMKVKEDSAF